MTARASAAIDEDNPWPGLGSFDEAAERFFNGRQIESAELRRLVLGAPLTVLFGASGLGKTSLLHAGLFPALRKEHYLPIYIRLDVRDESAPLIEQVKLALLAQFRQRRIDAPGIAPDESLWTYLHRPGLELWSEQNQLLSPVLVLDQFEEVFTLGAENPTGIGRLRVDLADLIENRMPAEWARRLAQGEVAEDELSLDSQRYKVILSFREDFLPAIEGWRREVPSLLRNRLRLLPMSGEQAFEAVYTTAARLVDEPLARDIVRFVAAAQDGSGRQNPESLSDLGVEPALLSLVCHGLNEKRKAQGKGRFDAALLSGTGQAVIADYYDRAVGDLPDRTQRFIENELITERGFRKACDVDDARSIHGVTDRELRLLVDRRLLRIEPQRGTERVELTHDLLTGVVRAHRSTQRERVRSRRQRRRMALFAAAVVLLVSLVALFGRLYIRADAARQDAERQAANAEGRRLATEALYRFDASQEGLELSGALAALAMAVAPSTEGWKALAQVVRLIPAAPARFPNAHQAPVQALTFTVDGRLMASAAQDGSAVLWDVSNAMRKTVLQGRFPSAPSGFGLALAPDGRWLAAGGMGSLWIWNTATAVPTEPPIEHDNLIRSVAFSPDGQHMATATLGSGLVRVFERTGDDWHELPGSVAATTVYQANSVTFVANGLLAIAGTHGSPHQHGVWFWNLDTGSEAFVRAGNPTWNEGKCGALALSADAKTLAALCSGGLLVANREEEGFRTSDASRKDAGSSEVSDGLSLSPDGHYVAAVSGGVIHVFGKQNEQEIRRMSGPAIAVAFRPDGQTLAAGLRDGSIALWPMTKGTEAIHVHIDGLPSALVFSPDERWLVTAGNDETVRVVDISHANASRTLHAIRIGSELGRPVFSPDGRFLLTPAHAGAEVFDTSGWKKLSPNGLPGEITAATFSPDSRLLVTVGPQGIRCFETTTWHSARPSLAGHFETIRFSPDGRFLAAFSERNLQHQGSLDSTTVWSAATGIQVASLEKVVGPFDQPAKASGDQRLVVASATWPSAADSSITGRPIGRVRSDRAISPDHTLQASPDGSTLDLTEATSKRTIARLEHGSDIVDAVFSARGQWLATSARDGTVRLWPLRSQAILEQACRLLPRNLTPDEWKEFKVDGPYRKACPALP
ncbi:putative protein containing caspase domain protein [Luteitalea pratensis]|uniref:Novel STAND NTPase 1 domain-containing protein n=1 Tax=Luteitalea pratensis TaxID=1855912 RepID=A0A143PRM6_LUTPR|nr:WD40 repeat domain-containing protein [Luteitalea pratensis]AMY10833.1 putative protein containing caspase domain protein [Luteitalea pratensis]